MHQSGHVFSVSAGGGGGAVPRPRRVPVHVALRGVGHAGAGGHGQRPAHSGHALHRPIHLCRARSQLLARGASGTQIKMPVIAGRLSVVQCSAFNELNSAAEPD